MLFYVIIFYKEVIILHNFSSYMQKVLKKYENCDEAHGISHIEGVWRRAKDIRGLVSENVDERILMTCCYFHDLGNLVNRKEHHLESGKMVLADKELLNFFSEDEIQLIKEAVEDHRTSLKNEPRNIYGKILKDADKDDDVKESLYRAYIYSKEKGLGQNEEEWIESTFAQLNKKFGKNGSVTYCILNENTSLFIKQMKQLAEDKIAFYSYMKAII